MKPVAEQVSAPASPDLTQQLREAAIFLENDVAAWLLALGAGCPETELLHRHIEFYKLALEGAVSAPASRAEQVLDAVSQTLNEHDAPTHDKGGAKLNANGRLVDFLAEVFDDLEQALRSRRSAKRSAERRTAAEATDGDR